MANDRELFNQAADLFHDKFAVLETNLKEMWRWFYGKGRYDILNQQDGWIPIETAPKDRRILLDCKFGTYVGIGQWYERGEYFRDDDGEALSPEYWQDLPLSKREISNNESLTHASSTGEK